MIPKPDLTGMLCCFAHKSFSKSIRNHRSADYLVWWVITMQPFRETNEGWRPRVHRTLDGPRRIGLHSSISRSNEGMCIGESSWSMSTSSKDKKYTIPLMVTLQKGWIRTSTVGAFFPLHRALLLPSRVKTSHSTSWCWSVGGKFCRATGAPCSLLSRQPSQP